MTKAVLVRAAFVGRPTFAEDDSQPLLRPISVSFAGQTPTGRNRGWPPRIVRASLVVRFAAPPGCYRLCRYGYALEMAFRLQSRLKFVGLAVSFAAATAALLLLRSRLE